MKKIKVKICGFNEKDEFSYGYFMLKILKKYYEVELSEDPEYLFYHDSSYEHLKYNCTKIFFTGENISPNFNLCDYAIGFDYISFQDRYYRLPLYLITVFYNKDELFLAGDNYLSRQIEFTKQNLLNKTDFCSFVYSNYLAGNERKLFFDKLSLYKKVNAGGGFLNNVGGRVPNKLEFESKHKFSIAFENSSRSGYTTEKIVTSLVAKTIPIYWGNPDVAKEFNQKRFINCHNYKSFDEVIDRIKEIDANDDLYLSIINEPIVSPEYNFEKVKNDFELFLRNIIDQPLELSIRKTINPARYVNLLRYEKIIANYVIRQAKIKKILAKIYRPFKKIRILEVLKYKYFSRKK